MSAHLKPRLKTRYPQAKYKKLIPDWLTEEHLQLVEAAYRLSVIDVAVTRSLFGWGERKTQEYLHDLAKNQYLYCLRRTHFRLPNIKNPSDVYLLGRSGAKLLVLEHGGKPNHYRYTVASNLTSGRLIEHDLATSLFRVQCERSVEKIGGRALRWLSEHQLRQLFRTIKRTNIPDGYLLAQFADGSRAHFFIELERETVYLWARWKYRFRGYTSLLNTNGFTKLFAADDPAIAFRVLTAVVRPERVRKLQRCCNETVVDRYRSMFLFASLNDASKADVFTSPIWLDGGLVKTQSKLL